MGIQLGANVPIPVIQLILMITALVFCIREEEGTNQNGYGPHRRNHLCRTYN